MSNVIGDLTRLQGHVRNLIDTIIAQAAEIQRLTRERDEAVSAKQRIWNVAIEQAAYDCADYPRLSPSEEEWTRYDEQIEHSQDNIRALLKDDATAALARRDAQMRAAGMREAAEWVRLQRNDVTATGEEFANAILDRAAEIMAEVV